MESKANWLELKNLIETGIKSKVSLPDIISKAEFWLEKNFKVSLEEWSDIGNVALLKKGKTREECTNTPSCYYDDNYLWKWVGSFDFTIGLDDDDTYKYFIFFGYWETIPYQHEIDSNLHPASFWFDLEGVELKVLYDDRYIVEINNP